MTDNELIAEFMGLERSKANHDYFFIPEYHAFVAPDNILYHQSWDWLMPVVEKIERSGTLFHTRIMCYADENNYLCDIVDIENNEASCQLSQTSKIDAVYKAVVGFIKWYNAQPK